MQKLLLLWLAFFWTLPAWAQRGLPVWFDEDIPTGKRWEATLRDRVAASSVVIDETYLE